MLLDLAVERSLNSKHTDRKITPKDSKANGKYSLPIVCPQAYGKAAANKPKPKKNQNSLASRHGFSMASILGFKFLGATKDKQPTPISKPSKTTPAINI